MILTGKFQDSAADEAKVFVGRHAPIGGPQLYLLEDGHARQITTEPISRAALAYLIKHMPPLTPEEIAGLEGSHTRLVEPDSQECDDNIKLFVCRKIFGGERLSVLYKNQGLELATDEPIEDAAMAYFKKHLPPLTAEEAAYAAQFSVKPAVPPLAAKMQL